MLSATPERSFSSIASMFFGRVSSALWSVSTTSAAMPPIYNQGALAISAAHMCYQPRIFGQACLDPESGIFPSSQQWRSSCLHVSSKVSYRRGPSRTCYSRSCFRGAAHSYGSLRCRNCYRGASSGPQVPPLLTPPASPANCRKTH